MKNIKEGDLCHHKTNNKAIYVFGSFYDRDGRKANVYWVDESGRRFHEQIFTFELSPLIEDVCTYNEFTGTIEIAK